MFYVINALHVYLLSSSYYCEMVMGSISQLEGEYHRYAYGSLHTKQSL